MLPCCEPYVTPHFSMHNYYAPSREGGVVRLEFRRPKAAARSGNELDTNVCASMCALSVLFCLSLDSNSDPLPGIESQAAEFTCLASFSRHSDLVCQRLVFPISLARASACLPVLPPLLCLAAFACLACCCLPGFLVGWHLTVWFASWFCLA
jgi:hypothetical protein